MRPGIINGARLTTQQRQDLVDNLLTPSGVRHYVPEDAVIIVRGRTMDVPTFDIERTNQPRQGRTRGVWRKWRTSWPGDQYELPVKVRTYNVRTKRTKSDPLQ